MGPQCHLCIVYMAILKVRYCWQDIWPEISTFEQEKVLYEAIQLQRKQLAPFHDEGCAVLPLMEAHVIDAACNDPGAALVPHLILPLLREQIRAKAAEAALQVTLQHCNSLHDDRCHHTVTKRLVLPIPRLQSYVLYNVSNRERG